MTEEKKKTIFIWSSVIGGLMILIIFIWSMFINIKQNPPINSNKTDSTFSEIGESLKDGKNQIQSEINNIKDSEVDDIINSVNQDAINDTQSSEQQDINSDTGQ